MRVNTPPNVSMPSDSGVTSSSSTSLTSPWSTPAWIAAPIATTRSEEHTSELQSLMRISYAVFCLKKKKHKKHINSHTYFQKKSNVQKHNTCISDIQPTHK